MALLGAPAASLAPNNQPEGYNVAFANELAFRLGLTSVIHVNDFSELISKLQSHECDITVSSQNITTARMSQVNLIPYTQAKLGFPVVVAFGNPRKITEQSALCGEQVSVAAGSTMSDALGAIDASCAASGLSAIKLRTYPSELDAVQALLDMTVDAYVGNANFVSQYPDLIEDAPITLPPARQGVGVALDHPALTAGVQAALGAMISDGTYLQILRQYVSENSIENFSIIGGQ